MSDNIPSEIKELFELAINLDVDIDSLYHVQLSNNMEMIGELFNHADFINSDATAEEIQEIAADTNLYFVSPIKIIRDSYIDQDGNYISNNFFVEWNPCIDGALAHINPNAIIGMNKPTDECVLAYLKALKDLYYGGDVAENIGIIDMDLPKLGTEQDSVKKQENVIDFQKYHKRKILSGK